MRFGQLLEYNMRKIFVEKSYTKCAGETIPGPLPNKSLNKRTLFPLDTKSVSTSLKEFVQKYVST